MPRVYSPWWVSHVFRSSVVASVSVHPGMMSVDGLQDVSWLKCVVWVIALVQRNGFK